LLSDTVGFISNLPHGLVKAFRSTLEEVKEADLLLHVIDYSDENHSEQIRVTQETLREIGAEKIPVIEVYNKADLCGMGEFATIQGNSRIYMSAKSVNGIEALLTLITGKLAGGYSDLELLIPYKRGDIVSYLNDNAVVYETQYREDGVFVKVNMRNVDVGRYSEFVLK
jgi:GTP-binding protein HflX